MPLRIWPTARCCCLLVHTKVTASTIVVVLVQGKCHISIGRGRGRIGLKAKSIMEILSHMGFEEYMNLILDDAREVNIKKFWMMLEKSTSRRANNF
ncbi:hypothetical protein ACB092_11G230400 [Castanea dentata]